MVCLAVKTEIRVGIQNIFSGKQLSIRRAYALVISTNNLLFPAVTQTLLHIVCTYRLLRCFFVVTILDSFLDELGCTIFPVR